MFISSCILLGVNTVNEVIYFYSKYPFLDELTGSISNILADLAEYFKLKTYGMGRKNVTILPTNFVNFVQNALKVHWK